jgi:hypothetical protein
MDIGARAGEARPASLEISSKSLFLPTLFRVKIVMILKKVHLVPFSRKGAERKEGVP